VCDFISEMGASEAKILASAENEKEVRSVFKKVLFL
jgi:hypothetical protein